MEILLLPLLPQSHPNPNWLKASSMMMVLFLVLIAPTHFSRLQFGEHFENDADVCTFQFSYW